VRTSAGAWEEVDVSLRDPARSTHGICPDCLVEETRAAEGEMELR
jgi:hypothetical protein